MVTKPLRLLLLPAIAAAVAVAAAAAEVPMGGPDPVTLIATRASHGAFAHSGLRSDSTMGHGHFGAELFCQFGAPAGGEALFLYPLQLPPQADTLAAVQLWGYDLDGGDLRVRLLRACTSFSPPFATRTILAEHEVPSQPGLGPVLIDLPVNLAPTIDPDCSVLLEVRVARNGQACQGNQVSVMRLRLQMRDPGHIFRDGFFQQERVPVAAAHAGGRP